MKVAGSANLPFPPEQAYDLMQNPDILAGAIPGCNSLELIGENEYKLNLKMVLASLSGLFEGKVLLSEPNRPYSFKMTVEGSGKIGFLKGEGTLSLLATEKGGTDVYYEGEAQIGGTMASVGQRLIDTTAKLMVKRFFKKLSAGAGGGDESTPEEPQPE